MPTQAEVRVLEILSAIEIDPGRAVAAIEALGDEAVTVLCEVASGSFPALRNKLRTNATALLSWSAHPQAEEALVLLIRDPNRDVAIRAIRGAARKRSEDGVPRLGQLLETPATDAITALEVVKALTAIDSGDARAALARYAAAEPERLPHRRLPAISALVARHKS